MPDKIHILRIGNEQSPRYGGYPVSKSGKFRSMIVNAEKDGSSIPAVDHDPRITRVGRVIRALRVDELPQIFNILSGKMSIVGPRPERIEHVQKYTQEIPEFAFRAKVKGCLLYTSRCV